MYLPGEEYLFCIFGAWGLFHSFIVVLLWSYTV